MLEVSIQVLLQAEFWAVAGQVKQLDLRALCEPGLHRFVVMTGQIVQDHEQFLAHLVNEGLQQ